MYVGRCLLESNILWAPHNIMDNFTSGWVGGWIVTDFANEENNFLSIELTIIEANDCVVYLQFHAKISQ